MIRDEPIFDTITSIAMKLLGEWRCTVPGQATKLAALEDTSLRRGTYVRARSAEEAAIILVEHEQLRPYAQIDVQRWTDANGEPLSDSVRREVIKIRAGHRCT